MWTKKGDKRAGEEYVSHYFYSERLVVKELQGTILQEMNCAMNVGCMSDKILGKCLYMNF